MIKFTKIGCLSVALLTSIVVNASKIFTTKSSKSKVVTITLTEVIEGEVLSINNANGLAVYSETLHQSDLYKKEIDFSTFPTGAYYLKANKNSNKNGVEVTQVFVGDKKVSIVSNAIKIFKTPEVKLKNNSVLKVLLNNPRNLAVNISIYDTNGIEIKSNYTNDKIVYRAYNFNALGKGTYTISIAQGDSYFITEEITF